MKPILLGMNNPLSSDPEHTLYPYPPGCTGNRIFHMIREHWPELTESEYLIGFDRRNLIVGDDWHLPTARRSASRLWSVARGRQIVFLGAEVANAMSAPLRTPLQWNQHADVRYVCVPHPSGRNRWYNEPGNRVRAGRLLFELFWETIQPVG